MSNIFSIFDYQSMTVNLKFSIFNGNGVQKKGSLGESCDQYVKGIVCVVLSTRCNLKRTFKARIIKVKKLVKLCDLIFCNILHIYIYIYIYMQI